MSQADRDRLAALKKADQKRIKQKAAASEIGVWERLRRRRRVGRDPLRTNSP
jgi:hypothetical protein